MGKAASVQHLKRLCCLGLDGKALVPELLRALHPLVPSHSKVFFWVDDRGEISDAYGESPEFYELIPTYFAEIHDRPGFLPHIASFRSFAREAPTVTQLSHRTGKALYASIFYDGIMRPAGYHDIAYVRVKEQGRPRGLMLLGRERGKSLLSGQEEAVLLQLAPYIAHALNPPRGVDDGEEDGRDTGLLVFGPRGKLEYASPKGKEFLFLATHPVVSPSVPWSGKIGQGAVPAVLARLCGKLGANLQDEGAPVLHHRNPWGSFTFRAHPLKGGTPDEELVGVTVERRIPRRLFLWSRAEALGLPPKQAAVCVYIALGLSRAAIAQELKISLDAVRWHVRELYARLDVHNSVELISRVAGSPSETI